MSGSDALPAGAPAGGAGHRGLAMASVAALIATAWSALLLAELGRFAGLLPLLAGAVAFFGVRRAVPSAAPLRPTAGGLVVAACALWVAAASLPPGEMILGGWDPGVYVHTAAGIARHGAVNFPAGDLATLPKSERRVISQDLGRRIQPFPGIFLLRGGRISPQFHHLYPALLAVGMSLAGVWGALLVNPLLATAAIPAIYALARRVVPGPWALAAPLILACNPATLWQAKFPTSEPLTQLLLIVGATLLVDALDGPAPPLVPLLAGACFGAAFLARYDTLLVLVPLAAILIALATEATRRRVVLLVLAPLAFLVVHAVVHTRIAVPVYVPLRRVVGPGLAVVAALLAVVLAAGFTPPGRRARLWLASRAHLARGVAALGLLAWAAFAWGVRPRLSPPVPASGPDPGLEALLQFLAGPGRDDFLFLADLMGAPGLVLGLAGVALALRRAATAGQVALLLPATAVLLVFGTNVFHDRSLMWVLRRFVPVTLPLLAIAVALVAAAAAAWLSRFGRRAAVGGGAAVLAVALIPNFGATAATYEAREWPGLVRWYDKVARAVPAGATVFTDLPGFGAPLRFLYSIKAYEYNHKNVAQKPDFFGVLKQRLDRGEAVFLLTKPGPPAAAGLDFQEQKRFALASSAVGRSRHGIPRESMPRVATIVLYRAQPGAAAPGAGVP